MALELRKGLYYHSHSHSLSRTAMRDDGNCKFGHPRGQGQSAFSGGIRMSGFREARLAKDEEKMAAADAANAERRDRSARIESLRRQVDAEFKDSQTKVNTRLSEDTLTIDREDIGYIDVTVRNEGKFFIKAGGVKGAKLATEVVRIGREVQGNDIFREIIDWYDGDLA